MKEVWKAISDFNNYEVSNLGRVRNITTGKVLKPVLDGRGYYKANLYKQNKAYTRSIHRLVATEFIPNSDKLPEVNHKDEDKTNNSIENLEWCSHYYNSNYGTRNERVAKAITGSLNYGAKRVKCVETAEIFNCTRDAARKYNLELFSVSNAANPNQLQKTAGGYHWEYIEDED